jgi:hypothetical protein
MLRTTTLSLLFLLVPAVGLAQGTGKGPAEDAKAGTSDKGDKGDKGEDAKGGAGADRTDRIVGGYTYSDKRPAGPTYYRAPRKGPHAAFPAFSMVDTQRSRLTIQLSGVIAVEEKKAPGTVTYVLKGAHVARHNDTHALIAVHFNTPMTVARLRNAGKDAELRVDLRAPVSPTFAVAQTKTGATLTIDFPSGAYLPDGALPPAPAASAAAPAASPAAPAAPPKP